MKNHLPFRIGTWEIGSNDGGNTNFDMLGREFCLKFRDFVNQKGSPVKGRLGETDVHVRLARNTSGVALNPSRVVQFDVTTAPTQDSAGNLATHGEGTIPLLENVAKEADAGALPFCGVVDPTISTPVADNGLFYVVVKGPVLVQLPAAGLALSIGNFVTSAAAGRIGVEAGLNTTRSTLGYAMQVRTSPAHDDGLALIMMNNSTAT